MTSEQIRKDNFEHGLRADGFWLREIAYQLAVMNERNTPLPFAEACAQADAAMLAIRDREKTGA